MITSFDELDPYFDDARNSLFRYEGLQDYSGEDGDEAVREFLESGATGFSDDNGWWQFMKEKVVSGLTSQRVRLVSEPQTDYTKFELAYLRQAAGFSGDEIKTINPEALRDVSEEPINDFWLVDNDICLLFHYADKGKWVGAELISDADIPKYQTLKAKLVLHSERLI